MDRMVQTALNSMKMLMENQVATAHNLSNLSTPGFKQDVVTDFSSIYLNRQEGLEPRIVAAREVGKFSVEQGMLDNTKNPMDVAINGDGYFVIQPINADPAFSRRGDFSVNENGELLDGAGNKVLDAGMQPLVIPAFREKILRSCRMFFFCKIFCIVKNFHIRRTRCSFRITIRYAITRGEASF